MPNQLHDSELVASIERDAGLEPGMLASLLALETEFPDLNARGQRRELLRTLSEIMDAAADGTEAG
ncbi:MAG: hypothetical protein MEQ84_13920 [Mesorhizobium sp.]|nr:hypothetical protein [Mesorhizobium sp.]